MATHERDGFTIVTSFVYPPVPVRDWDWQATLDSYDYCAETGGSCPVGEGATEEAAILDLLERIEEESEEAWDGDHGPPEDEPDPDTMPGGYDDLRDRGITG